MSRARFSADGPWPTPWLDRVLPVVTELASRHPERTVFTRFIPPERATDMPGLWQRYYSRWKDVTRQHLDPPLWSCCHSSDEGHDALITLFRQPLHRADRGRRRCCHHGAVGILRCGQPT